MLKKKTATVLVTLTFVLVLIPAVSQAAPLGLSHDGEVTVFDQIVQLWDRLAGHAFGRTPAPPRAANLPKNGCGIDPNGAPIPCAPGSGPGPGTQATAPPDGGGGSGS